MNDPAWAALRAQEVTMFYGHRRKGLYTRKAQLAYLGSPYKMEKVYAKAFHGFLKPYFSVHMERVMLSCADRQPPFTAL